MISTTNKIFDPEELLLIENCSDGYFKTGKDGVEAIYSTKDKKVEFVIFPDRTLAYVKSAMGYPLRKGEVGTLGELSPKPHPWLYAEVARVGLGIPFEERHSVVGMEDSGAGVCSVVLAGYACIGIADGNIIESGTKSLCHDYVDDLQSAINLIL